MISLKGPDTTVNIPIEVWEHIFTLATVRDKTPTAGARCPTGETRKEPREL